MTGPVVDARERAAALDPRHSCIVQAPAGSGKTGLLIQRVLRLLAGVERPEEILAITFTRKAAGEMRRRVLEALERAANDTPPDEANARLTWELARAALARDRERGWELVANAARLRIQTIDSLSASLARQMPVLARLGAPPALADKPQPLYREAAERTLAAVESAQAEVAAPVRRLLEHLDGDWGAARVLLEGMLARREQWLGRVLGFPADAAARSALEQSFRGERSRLLGRMRSMLPDAEETEIVRLAAYAAANVATANPASPIARLAGLTRYPPGDEAGADDWCALAALLLVSDGAWRARLDKTIGFPAERGAEALFKEPMKDLLERLRAIDGLCEALNALRAMPPPRFSDAQWEVLGAMVALLPRAAAELQLVFAEHGEIDFPGMAQAAVQALGDEDDPTDLLLALDVTLKHLLVDEFQDTSRAQWALLTRLTAGWAEGDGRTVFLVGDPMQSIYRFREADVALFLRARSTGLPSVALDDLRLATNFRSQGALVEWVNQAFAAVLGRSEDADAGAVPYTRSSAHHGSLPENAVQWHAFVGRDMEALRSAEAERVARLAGAALAASDDATVAVLVRNRSHLDRIVPRLKEAGIGFRAVDIEPLGARPVIQDLLALTRALAHPADRVAWLALLRAPWCALTVAELHALAGADLPEAPARLSVWETLDDEHISRLGAAASRVRRLRAILAPFVAARLRGSLRERIEQAWLALGGPACVEHDADLEDAETFFDQLDRLEKSGDLADPALLEEQLLELYAAPDAGAPARLQLMTIHKAKGLEFTTVIVPGLDRMPRAGDRPLFAWKARPDGSLIMAPVRAAGESEEPGYDYLRALDAEAAEHEVKRLLYVAATRARTRLHLLGCARLDAKGALRAPPERSLLGKAWSVAREHFEAARPAAEAQPVASQAPGRAPRAQLRRLDVSRIDIEMASASAAPPAIAASAAPSEAPPAIEFSWVGETARHVGTLTHRWLQRIAADGPAAWDVERIAGLAPAIERELSRRGVPPAERGAAGRRVAAALTGTLADPRGRWILERRPDARSEHRMRVAFPDGVRLVVIDRVFTDDDGERWIVDYKTSLHEGSDTEGFLDRELERYAAQLAQYAAAFAGERVRLGLYFPLMRGWRVLAR